MDTVVRFVCLSVLLVQRLPISIQVVTECNSTDYFGENDPSDKTQHGDNGFTGRAFQMRGYPITCCGVVETWTAHFDNIVGSSATIWFQLWRPVNASYYNLVGENSLTISKQGKDSLHVSPSVRNTVKPGDIWGWWNSKDDIIPYKGTNGETNDNFIMATGDVTSGTDVDWSGASEEDERSYAVRLDIDINSDPFFTNLPASVTISNSDPVGTSVFRVTASDPDADDIATMTVMLTSSTYFTFDESTYILSVSSSSGTTVNETLEFVAVDQCEHSATGTLTVTISNEPPTLLEVPAARDIREDIVIETLLFTINVTDSFSLPACTFSTSVPTSYPFTVRQIAFSTDTGIYVQASPGFNYTQQNHYPLDVDCTDGEFTVTGRYNVFLKENEPPEFVNLQNSKNMTTTVFIGSNVFNVIVTDPENDSLTFSMTSIPANCPFSIFASGAIQVSEDLTGHTTVGYDLLITVSDGKNTVGPRILTVIFLDINDPVRITNLPLTSALSVQENMAIGTSLYTVYFSDVDTQTHTFSMTSSPGSGLSYFNIDSTSGVVSVIGSLDYESLSTLGTTSFNLSISVFDSVVTDTDYLVIDVANVNEAPGFSQSSYGLSTAEGRAGAVIGTPAFSIFDPDSGDSYTFSMDCGAYTSRFAMDRNTGQVTFQSDYDLDTGSLPTSVSCTTYVTDIGGLNSTASLIISIADENDNVPIFSPSAYSFFVSYYAAAGTTVGQVTATDNDIGTYGDLTFTLDQTSLSQELFSIDQFGVITVGLTPYGSSIGSSTSVTVIVTASDVDGQTDTVNVVIVISGTSTTSATTSATDRYRTFLEDNANIAWLSLCLFTLVITAVYLAWLVYTCRGRNSCANFKRRLYRRKTVDMWHIQERDPYMVTPPPDYHVHTPNNYVTLPRNHVTFPPNHTQTPRKNIKPPRISEKVSRFWRVSTST